MDVVPWGFLSDPVSSGLHLSTAVVAAMGIPRLLRRRFHLKLPVWSHAVFGLSVITLFAVSGTYHMLDHAGDARAWMQRLDHAAIFLLIAGSFTPIVSDHFSGGVRKALLAAVWLVAGAGMVAKVFFFSSISHGAGVAMYLALGWTGLVGGVQIARRHGMKPFLPMLWGGLAYSVGAVMEFTGWPVMWDGVVGPHEVFHVFVIAGAAFHWWFIHRSSGTLPRLARGLVPAPA